MRNKIVYVVVALLAVVAVGYAGWQVYGPKTNQKTQQAAKTTPTPTPIDHSVKYQGRDGQTALDLLKQHYPGAVISGKGSGAFVTSINGYAAKADKHEFWKLVVNGKDANVGAGSYMTKDGDTITWVIDTY